jgi:hypothetical protein
VIEKSSARQSREQTQCQKFSKDFIHDLMGPLSILGARTETGVTIIDMQGGYYKASFFNPASKNFFWSSPNPVDDFGRFSMGH